VRVGGVERTTTIKTANGDISVARAGADVVAKAANGHLRVGEAVRGSLELSTARGNIDVGVAEGTAARLDVRTQFGHVDQQLRASDGPPASGEKLEVRGRTSFGTITIARAGAEAS
jgi:DUF4097 and DUF4098 domain-containing protein YvlB